MPYIDTPDETHLEGALDFLREEDKELGHSFICNESVIVAAHSNKEARYWVSDDGEVVAFLIYSQSGYCTTIDIVATDFRRRGRGFGKQLVKLFEKEARESFVTAAFYLQCQPPESEGFWRRMGFVDLPELTQMTKMDRYKALYKMLHPLPPNDIDPDVQIDLWDVDFYKGIPDTEQDFQVLLNANIDHTETLAFHVYDDQAIRVTVGGMMREDKVKYSPLWEYREGSFVLLDPGDVDFLCEDMINWVHRHQLTFFYHNSYSQHSTLTPQVGANRHGGEDPRAVGQAVVWLNTDPGPSSTGSGGVHTFQHVVQLQADDPNLFVDKDIERGLNAMADAGFSEPRIPLESGLYAGVYFYTGSINVVETRRWNPERSCYEPI